MTCVVLSGGESLFLLRCPHIPPVPLLSAVFLPQGFQKGPDYRTYPDSLGLKSISPPTPGAPHFNSHCGYIVTQGRKKGALGWGAGEEATAAAKEKGPRRSIQNWTWAAERGHGMPSCHFR